MSFKQFFDRTAAVYLVAMIFLSAFIAMHAEGTPIQPDIKKLAEEAQQPRPVFIPSRVGWNGPEMRVDDAARDMMEASMSPILAAERERRVRATLRELAIPEPRAIMGIAAIIFLLRKMRSLREQQAVLARQPQAA